MIPSRTRGADEQAGLLGLHMDLAHEAGCPVGGLTVDWSKCYDRLPLEALERVAVAAGLPSELWRPMLAAYRLPRLVRADGLGGHAKAPLCGLAPGCPAATDWLALVMHCWAARVRVRAPGLVTRAYVDDLSAYTRDRGSVGDVQVAWEVTEAFGAAFRLQLNSAKSVRYASQPADQAWLRGQPGPPVCASFRDLGVVQRVGRQRGDFGPGIRMAAAYGRLTRIARLLVPYAVRLLLVAASAVSSMMYGAGQAFVPLADLRPARRRVYEVLTRKRFRASGDALAVLYGVPWRVDPLAYAVVAPWRFLLGAIADGHASREAVEAAVAAPRAGGPCAAAAAGLTRAGVRVSDGVWLGAHGDTLASPLAAPRAQVEEFLHASWQSARWAELRAARRHYEAVPMPDVFVMRRELRRARPRDEAGALQAVLGGSVVTQDVASKWTGVRRCPWCPAPVEDWEHRFWQCPRWRLMRAQELGDCRVRWGLFGRLGFYPWIPSSLRSAGRAKHTACRWRPRPACGSCGLTAAPLTRRTPSCAAPLGRWSGGRARRGAPRPAACRGPRRWTG